ncbi:uncharacterized protein LOC143228029 [Tachypleus tridentatus]|uniref:uncharacterized protein LOC143228029 n=1 Tax=Tachypleus tridentatus TaxID=6853 RepID=UPI003FD62101
MKLYIQTFIFAIVIMWFAMSSNCLPICKEIYNLKRTVLENDLHQKGINSFTDAVNYLHGEKIGQSQSEKPNSPVKKSLSLFTYWRPKTFADNGKGDSDFFPAVGRGSFIRPRGQPLRWG